MKYLYALEHRLRYLDGREEHTLAFLSPERDKCLDFMARNKDTSDREGKVWWWTMSLEEVEADWALHSLPTEEDLWHYSWDGELMNYQPCGAYWHGVTDPDSPPAQPPPKMAGGS